MIQAPTLWQCLVAVTNIKAHYACDPEPMACLGVLG